jgi:hypothetical protein
VGRVIVKEPPAKTLITGIRAIGYSFSTAVADIIDNSISAQAHCVDIISEIDESAAYVEFLDDGIGMTYFELENAMLLGSNREGREDSELELGRFGLGLKAASLSQCRVFTVASKLDDEINAISFDLNLIERENKWNLKILDNDEISEIPNIDRLHEHQSGTLVLWQNFDKMEGHSKRFEDTFREMVAEAKKHVELVFHRFYATHDIFFNNRRIEKRDPFLLGSAPRQQTGHTERLRVNGQEISVTPYTLPYWNTITDEEKALLGYPKSLHDDQGFYIYRNKRLISWGSWFRMGLKSEQNKLARVQVDIPSSLDSIWMLDVKKSSARIPDIIREELRASVKDSFVRSKKTVRFPGLKEQRAENPVWIRTSNLHDKTALYSINRDNPLLTELFDNLGQGEARLLEILLSQIETTLPKHSIWNDHMDDTLQLPNRMDLLDTEQQLAELADILSMAAPQEKEALLDRLLATESYSNLKDNTNSITRRLLAHG